MTKKQHIYYADDDQDDTDFFHEAIASLGHHAQTFPNGRSLVDTLCSSMAKPDIIFIDVHMPQSLGPKILEEIRKCSDYKAIPVILLTGFSKHSTEVRKYIEAGANYLLEKPSDFKEYTDSLSKILNMDWKNYKPKADDFLSA